MKIKLRRYMVDGGSAMHRELAGPKERMRYMQFMSHSSFYLCMPLDLATR